MYHYVRPDGDEVPAGIRPLLVSEFEAQLDWLAERYDIVGAEDFLFKLNQQEHGKPPCLLTFDDGTRDHAEVVAPILARRGLSGVFFVLTWPTLHGRMPLTHAVHWLLGQDEQQVWEAFERVAHDAGVSTGSPAEAEQIYYYEPPPRARIKYAANMALPPDLTERVVTSAVERSGRTMRDLAGEWFAPAEQIVQMHQAGMTIGMHGASHRSLQSLGPAGIAAEIGACAAWLTDLLGQPPTWFACPFGGSGATPDAVTAMHDALRRHNVRAAVTAEKATVAPGTDPLAIPRLDAIDLPPRRAVPALPL